MLMSELNNKSNNELLKLVEDLKAELFMLRFKNSTGQLENPHKISLVKKDIAKVFTALNTNDKEKSKAKEKNRRKIKVASAKPKMEIKGGK
ncbi:MAG: 50S ribosomal protein L29 [Mycoplasmatales bacterium]|nr:50S ribosomal protein L29 [Mycoplasmatales bacterium]